MLFTVKDGSTDLAVAGVTVVVTLDSDGTTVFSGTTDANGQVDFTVPLNVAHSILAFKPDVYDGVKLSVVNRKGMLYPNSLSFLKVASRTMKLAIFLGDYSSPLGNARVEVTRPDGSSFLVANTGSDGKYQTNLQADLSGWSVTVQVPGLDGVKLPLDKIDLVGEVKIVLSPVV